MASRCRGLCDNLGVKYPVNKVRQEGGSVYDYVSRCDTCSKWLDKEIYSGRCPCCNLPVSKKSRNHIYRKRRTDKLERYDTEEHHIPKTLVLPSL